MKKLLTIMLSLILISSVSALQIKFFYSESCPYCKNIYPAVEQLSKQYDYHDWEFLETKDHQEEFSEYGFRGVPAFVFTGDYQEVKFSGADERRLFCETAQESIKGVCETYSSDNCISESWFK